MKKRFFSSAKYLQMKIAYTPEVRSLEGEMKKRFSALKTLKNEHQKTHKCETITNAYTTEVGSL
jgi:hypothetical protein